MEPRYKHDCEDCIFLGPYTEWEDDGSITHYDLYYADHEGLPETVIARFGDDGPAYSSGMCFADGTVRPLREAMIRAHLLEFCDYVPERTYP